MLLSVEIIPQTQRHNPEPAPVCGIFERRQAKAQDLQQFLERTGIQSDVQSASTLDV